MAFPLIQKDGNAICHGQAETSQVLSVGSTLSSGLVCLTSFMLKGHEVPLAICLRCRHFIGKAYLWCCSLKSSRVRMHT